MLGVRTFILLCACRMITHFLWSSIHPPVFLIFLRTCSRSGTVWDVDPQHWSVFLNAKWSVVHWYWCILGKVCLISPSNSFGICILFNTVGGRAGGIGLEILHGLLELCVHAKCHYFLYVCVVMMLCICYSHLFIYMHVYWGLLLLLLPLFSSFCLYFCEPCSESGLMYYKCKIRGEPEMFYNKINGRIYCCVVFIVLYSLYHAQTGLHSHTHTHTHVAHMITLGNAHTDMERYSRGEINLVAVILCYAGVLPLSRCGCCHTFLTSRWFRKLVFVYIYILYCFIFSYGLILWIWLDKRFIYLGIMTLCGWQ